MSNREYAVAMKGQSWKFRLMNVIDEAMKQSGSVGEFKAVMKSCGYDMNWTDERKYITFLCPDGNKCRDIKLHGDKYLKGCIENELKYREQLTSISVDEEDYQTGWEIEREIYLGNILNDRRQTHRTSQTEDRIKKSNDENRFPDRTNFGITLADGLHGIASLGSIIDNDTDDEEERKKRRQAKDAGAGLGLALGTAAEIVSALATKNEFPQELEDEQEEIEDEFDEDIDEGFNMSM